MMTTYEVVKRQSTRRFRCSVCQREGSRSKTFRQTLNPFNKNAQGQVKTRREILLELDTEVTAWNPTMHQRCENMPDSESQGKVKDGLTLTYDALIDLLAAHRPYGLDCKCNSPINSDRDWAHHLAQMLALTQEWADIFTHVCRCPGCGCSSCELEERRGD